MAHAIRFHRPGGPEVLAWEEIQVGEPGPGQALLRQTAVGLNYIDVYHRTGLYPIPSFPAVPGMEGAGVVEAVGPGVEDLKPGDRVAYASGPMGSYAEKRVMAADRLVKLPDWLDDRRAAALMLQGMTAQMLLRSTYRVQAGDTVLVHAAAGGVGTILCQWARGLGATVIGTVGSDEKAELARANGCEHPIVYTRENFVERVREIAGGKGLPVVYDSVGQATFAGSLDCLRPRGLMVLFGQSSGAVAPFDPNTLASKGSLYLTRPTLFHYIASRAELEASASELFEAVRTGMVKIELRQTFALKDAADAHRALEGRTTTGSTVLVT